MINRSLSARACEEENAARARACTNRTCVNTFKQAPRSREHPLFKLYNAHDTRPFDSLYNIQYYNKTDATRAKNHDETLIILQNTKYRYDVAHSEKKNIA